VDMAMDMHPRVSQAKATVIRSDAWRQSTTWRDGNEGQPFTPPPESCHGVKMTQRHLVGTPAFPGRSRRRRRDRHAGTRSLHKQPLRLDAEAGSCNSGTKRASRAAYGISTEALRRLARPSFW
jgi:hypothetical protein